MKKTITLLILFLPLFSISQGIKFEEGLTWEQVKAKAKAENKYIFVDCYATWCGPCKKMDKEVYINDTIGDFFNETFIAVKVQMDQTAKDDENIKLWYDEAGSLKKQYHIGGYPTFLFFSPEGKITEKQMGFKQVEEFLKLVKSAIVPDKVYNDPYADYDRKVTDYKQGIKDYDQYPSMIKFADRLKDTALSSQLTKELTDYVLSLPSKERYTKERIEFWNAYTWTSSTRVFGFFYKDARLVNKVMSRKGYAESFIDKTIQYEIALPFLKEEAKGSKIAIGGNVTYVGLWSDLKPDSSEADWNELSKLVKSKYGKDYANRNVLKARVEWYRSHWNKTAVIKFSLDLFNQYPPDINDESTTPEINGPAWDAFLMLTDKGVLKGYVKWMKKVVKKWPQRDDYIDTYANLLYKLGHKKQAIEWEEKAVKLVPNDKTLFTALEQMKKGEPTYLNKGAIWEGIK